MPICRSLAMLAMTALADAPALPPGEARDTDADLICGKSELAQLTPVEHARFHIGRTGDVTAGPGEGMSIRWTASGRPILRVEVHRGGKLVPVACASIAGETGYGIKPELLVGADYAVVQVFDIPSRYEQERAREVQRARARSLATPELAWGEVVRISNLGELKAAAQRRGASSAERQAAHDEVAVARQGLASLKRAHEGQPGEWSKAVVAQIPRAQGLVKSVEAALKGLSDAISALEKQRRGESKAGTAEALRHLETAVAEAEDSVVAEASKLPSAPTKEETRVYCEGRATYEWNGDSPGDARARLIVRAELPLDPPGQVVTAVYGEGGRSSGEVKGGTRLTVLLSEVPTGERATFKLHQGQKLRGAGELLSDFLILISKLPYRAASYPPACDGIGDLRVDPEAPPLAPFGSRVMVVPRVPEGYATSIHVCSGADCTPGKPDSPVRNQIDLEILPSWRVTLLAELGGTVPTPGDAFGRPAFEPIGGTTGPDQLYQLRRDYDARGSFGVSILLAIQRHRWLAALGPTIWTPGGGGPSALTQWNLRGGYHLGEGFVVTAGPTMRIGKEAIDYRDGDVIAVPRPATEAVKAPQPRERDKVVFGVTVGLSVDFAVLGEAGAGLLKAFGVSK